MEEIRQEQDKKRRAFLVGIQDSAVKRQEAEDHLSELASLCDTMGAEVAGQMVIRIDRPTPGYYLGKGKVEELKALATADEVEVIVFDVDLTPSQQRNWEKETELAVIDRQEVILDIFASRAQTREARLQVGLARMEYSLPRLKRAWTHLERQKGGAGLRGGAGELQLEVDRRLVMERIQRFKQQLIEVRKQRKVQRKSRRGRPVPTAAIVGYTNAGKSSLLRKLTGADVLIEDKLFATLDTTTRRLMLPNNQPLLLTDTVGFIRKLPHDLVDAFKATLEEAVEADFLIHVLDVTHPKVAEQYQVTNQVLEELGAHDKPTMLVLNKIDQEYDPYLLAHFRARDGGLVFPVSTQTGEGIEELLAAFAKHFVLPLRRASLHLPMNRFDLVDLLHREGDVIEERHEADGVWMEVEFPERYLNMLEEFMVERIAQ